MTKVTRRFTTGETTNSVRCRPRARRRCVWQRLGIREHDGGAGYHRGLDGRVDTGGRRG